jgi:hypothetical protein
VSNVHPEATTVVVEQARCYDALGQWDQARAVLEHGLRRFPRDADLWVTFTTMAIARRDAPALRRVFATVAPPAGPLAGIDAARVFLAEADGDLSAVTQLLDPSLVRESVVCPPGDPLLDAVLREVMTTTDFVQDPEGKTTDGGWQGNLTGQRSRPAWEALSARIRASVERYVDDLIVAGHPMASAPASVRLTAWVVRLHAGGFQHPHIHATAWISGVCYLAVPDLSNRAVGDAGCLVLPGTTIAPRPGRLVLFPSYMRHRTVPFDGDGERVCIAFDVKAAAATRDSESDPTTSE